MDAERFERLAQAYGGDLRRWPEAERGAAQAFATGNTMQSERLLFEARQLDAALDAAPRPAPSMALRDRVLEAAPRPSRARAEIAGFPVGRWVWGACAGIAAACMAGALVGAVTVQTATAGPRADVVLAANDSTGWADAYAAEGH